MHVRTRHALRTQAHRYRLHVWTRLNLSRGGRMLVLGLVAVRQGMAEIGKAASDDAMRSSKATTWGSERSPPPPTHCPKYGQNSRGCSYQVSRYDSSSFYEPFPSSSNEFEPQRTCVCKLLVAQVDVGRQNTANQHQATPSNSHREIRRAPSKASTRLLCVKMRHMRTPLRQNQRIHTSTTKRGEGHQTRCALDCSPVCHFNSGCALEMPEPR